MREGLERRHGESDLETGRAQMLEILEQILPLVNQDAVKNEQYHQLIKDIRKVNNALDLKNIYHETKRRLEDLNIGGTGGSRPQDREEIHKLQIKLSQLPVELFE
ncbi:MAG: hypothetical protein KW788_04950 [Candidatus Doudnabacteria bacterium]|nr:hypothetical protein [Candidatus Doudnabacteria bacterium]